MQPLHLVLGRNVLNLARCMADRIKDSECDSVYVLVPDQYTLTAERFYMARLGERALRGVRVLSMKRLASEVFSSSAQSARILGEGGKRILVREAYDNVRGQMLCYRSCGSVNFINSLCEQIREFKIYRIAPEDLILPDGEYPSAKIHDIALIYEEYNRLLQSGYTDPGDRLDIMCREIAGRGLYGNAVFFVDFFKVLNASELNVVKTLWLSGAEVTVSLRTFDSRDSFDFSSPVASVYRRIIGFVRESGGQLDEYFIPEPWSDNGSMAFAEKNLFSRSPAVYGRATDSVSFYRASDAYDEIDRIASQICVLVRDKGIRYRDIAVVTGDISGYEAYLDTVFSEYDIPVFYHRKASLRQKIPVKFVISLLNACISRDAYLHILEMLRTGVLEVSEAEAADFEEYVYTWGLKYYSHFTRPFVRSIRGFQPVASDGAEDAAALKNAEKVRVLIMQIIEDFKNKCSRCTVREMCGEIYGIFCRTDMEGFLQKTSDRYREYGESVLYSENLQVYRQVISALDELVYTGSDRVIDIKEFRDIFIQAADGFSIDIIPTSADEVLAGNADTIPLIGQKYVFVFGLCEGRFPAAPSSDGLINDRDREIFEKVNVRIGIRNQDKYLYELFTAYTALTSASEHVSVSYPSVHNGEQSASCAYTDMRNIFSLCEETFAPDAASPEQFRDRVQRPVPAFGLMARTGFEDLHEYFSSGADSKYFGARELSQSLEPGTAAVLFGRDMSLSATKVDVFFHCKYRYFYKYGLGLRSREQARFDPRNAGTFIHAMFERIMSDASWMELSDRELVKAVGARADEYFGAILVDGAVSAAFGVYKNNLVRKVCKHLFRMRDELRNSSFVPKAFEVSVSKNGRIEPVQIEVSGGSVHMTGQIDRVDAYEHGGRTYIRVVDYKSGRKKFDLGCVYNGIDIQLLMYMYALRNSGTGLFGSAEPAGVMYVSVKQGITNELEPPASEDSGMYLDDDNVREAVTGDRYGKFGKGFDIASAEDFELIFEHIRRLLAGMGQSLLAGDVSKNPLRVGSKVDGCRNCDLRDVCEHFGKYTEAEPKSAGDTLETLREEAYADGK